MYIYTEIHAGIVCTFYEEIGQYTKIVTDETVTIFSEDGYEKSEAN